jgi:hypothetical protein
MVAKERTPRMRDRWVIESLFHDSTGFLYDGSK